MNDNDSVRGSRLEGTFGAIHYVGRRVCPECGKDFAVTAEWAYKVKGVYLCGYTCFRKADKRRERENLAEMRKARLAQLKKEYRSLHYTHEQQMTLQSQYYENYHRARHARPFNQKNLDAAWRAFQVHQNEMETVEKKLLGMKEEMMLLERELKEE